MFKFMSKKASDMTGWDCVKMSGVVTALCAVPYLGYIAYEWIDDKITEKKRKKNAKKYYSGV